jgi:hypothetical protein
MGMKTMQHRAQITGSKLSVEDLAKGGTQVRCVTPLRQTQTNSPEQRPEPIPPLAQVSAGNDA